MVTDRRERSGHGRQRGAWVLRVKRPASVPQHLPDPRCPEPSFGADCQSRPPVCTRDVLPVVTTTQSCRSDECTLYGHYLACKQKFIQPQMDSGGRRPDLSRIWPQDRMRRGGCIFPQRLCGKAMGFAVMPPSSYRRLESRRFLILERVTTGCARFGLEMAARPLKSAKSLGRSARAAANLVEKPVDAMRRVRRG